MRKVEITKAKGYHILWIDGYPWMWDFPQEIELQKKVAQKAEGDVLVAGYGFGIVQKFLLENDNVTSVTTIEFLPEVIELCKEHLGEIYGDVIFSDFYEYESDRKYDCIVGDIWPDIDKEFLDDYIKFENKGKQLIKEDGKILAWGDDYYKYLMEKQSK